MPKHRKIRQLVIAALTFAVALLIGLLMQYGDAIADRWGVEMPAIGKAELGDAPVLPVVASQLETPSLPLPELRVPADDLETRQLPDLTVPPVAAPDAPVAEDCRTYLTASAAEFAMVELSLLNLCRPNAVIALHHQGMMFNVLTDDAGAARLSVPALAKEAFFIVAYDDGDGAVALTEVPDLALYDRAVLQWRGVDDVQLHAFEFGATYDEPGHVWAGAPTGAQGSLVRLGNDRIAEALMAEVYTIPRSLSAAYSGDVALNVEVEVTARNCGRKVEAETLQVNAANLSGTTDLVMTMPDCTAVGEFLVLKNMFEDLKLAAK